MISAVARLGRLGRTVRWLRAEQVLGRLRLRLPRARPELGAAPPLRASQPGWVPPAARESSLTGPTRMNFLGEEHDLADIGWDEAGIALLWRYNLHYFDDLNAFGAPSRREWHRALVQRWLAENPPGRGTAWAPYPVSLRLVNWIKWFAGGEEPAAAAVHSLAVQARWLMRRIEWHLLGNHLFANAKALVFAGLYFEGAEARAWLAEGLRILERELPEQMLADGAQFERTPMYHALALEDVLDLINIIAARAPAASTVHRLVPELHRHGRSMLHWLRCLQHPSGALARFNDCAEGIAPAPHELERFAAALGITAQAASAEGVQVMQPSGYVRAVRGGAVALLDVAPIGPDYLPGHAHADTLSFELSVHGREVVVNRGTSVYGSGPRRLEERGTAAHSTLQIGAHDSSEVWAGFRVGRRARPGPLSVQGWVVECSHDGYTHLPSSPRHHRRWQLDANCLVVEDRLEPPARESAVARFHLAPDLTIKSEDARTWRVHHGHEIAARISVIVGRATLDSTLHAQRFGVLVEAKTLVVQLEAGRSTVRLSWDP